MFDDVQEPEDIFAGTDPVGPQKAPGEAAETVSAVDPVIKAGPSPLVYIVIAAIVFGAVGGGGYYWWSVRSGNLPTAGDTPGISESTGDTVVGDTASDGQMTTEPLGDEAPVEPGSVTELDESDITEPDEPESGSAATEPVNDPEPDTFMDTDGDGLDDDEEAGLGTNPQAMDTDSDGLSDFDEVRIYKTNPIMPDTDGDGFLDGQEVAGGYNPNGSGKLFEIPKQ